MKITGTIIKHLTHSFGLPVLKLFIKPNVLPYSKAELSKFPESTLGKDLFSFLSDHKLNLLDHFETHDAKHVLLGYGTSDTEEAQMQFFFLGNGTYSIPVLSTALFCMFLLPKEIPAFVKAFKRGGSCPNIRYVKLEDCLYETTSGLKLRLLNNK